MSKFLMEFVRSQRGVNTEVEDWDAGLVNFGFESLDEPGRIELQGETIEEARAEAAHHWAAWKSSGDVDGEPVGYWIMGPGGSVVDIQADHPSPRAEAG